MAWIREPLLHFAVIGAGIFALHATVTDRPAPVPGEIQITEATVRSLGERWRRQWGTSPQESQLQFLLQELVREEVLYREALALGLDQEDPIVRRRLAQKMEFFLQDASVSVEPTDSDLSRHLEAHRESYATPARASFDQIYFSHRLRGAGARDDAARALLRLRSQSQIDASSFVPPWGDPLPSETEPFRRTHSEVADGFGQSFADALFALAPGRWEGPIESIYGFHLVLVSETIAARSPILAEVRDRVRSDLLETRRLEAGDAAYEALRRRYRVTVNGPVLAMEHGG